MAGRDHKATSFAELNRLQGELDAYRVKYENQVQEARAHASRVQTLELEVKDLQDRLLDAEAQVSQQLSTDQVMKLQNQIGALEAQNQGLRAEISSMVTSMEASTDHSQRQNQQFDELQQSFAQVKTLAATTERKLKATEGKLSEMQRANEEVQKQHEDAQRRIAEMEEQSKRFLAVQAERDAAIAEVKRMEDRVEDISRNATSRQHALQNDLQRTRQLLEELKVEYEEFSEVIRLEHDIERRALRAEHQELVERFESHKLRELEVTQGLLQEQQDIVHALQAQFLEYRNTAEILFESEARKLEEKLKNQAEMYELELSAIVKARDNQYLQMVTSKDAKIMSLIEGTDMQRVMMRHQAEIDQLKQQHQRDIQLAREIVQSEQRKLVSGLKEQVRELENQAEAHRNEILERERQVQEKDDYMRRYKSRIQAKEAQHERTRKEQSAQLNQAYMQIEQLTQVRENLRHRILRLRLRLEGKADESVESVVRRLSLESERLNRELRLLTAKYTNEVTQRQQAQQRLERSERSKAVLERELASRQTEYVALVKTFERMLKLHGQSQVQSGNATRLEVESVGGDDSDYYDNYEYDEESIDGGHRDSLDVGDATDRSELDREVNALAKEYNTPEVAAAFNRNISRTPRGSVVSRNVTPAYSDPDLARLQPPSIRPRRRSTQMQRQESVIQDIKDSFRALKRFKSVSEKLKDDPFGHNVLRRHGLISHGWTGPSPAGSEAGGDDTLAASASGQGGAAATVQLSASQTSRTYRLPMTGGRRPSKSRRGGAVKDKKQRKGQKAPRNSQDKVFHNRATKISQRQQQRQQHHQQLLQRQQEARRGERLGEMGAITSTPSPAVAALRVYEHASDFPTPPPSRPSATRFNQSFRKITAKGFTHGASFRRPTVPLTAGSADEPAATVVRLGPTPPPEQVSQDAP